MFWRDWSDFKRAQLVNGLLAVGFLLLALRMWSLGNGLWSLIFFAAAVINTAGGLWRAGQNRRGANDAEGRSSPTA
jgi:hypothetical protein